MRLHWAFGKHQLDARYPLRLSGIPLTGLERHRHWPDRPRGNQLSQETAEQWVGRPRRPGRCRSMKPPCATQPIGRATEIFGPVRRRDQPPRRARYRLLGRPPNSTRDRRPSDEGALHGQAIGSRGALAFVDEQHSQCSLLLVVQHRSERPARRRRLFHAGPTLPPPIARECSPHGREASPSVRPGGHE
jgi:hypothetical protein